MSNRDAVVTDHDFLDEHSDDVLAVLHIYAFDVSAKTLEERGGAGNLNTAMSGNSVP